MKKKTKKIYHYAPMSPAWTQCGMNGCSYNYTTEKTEVNCPDCLKSLKIGTIALKSKTKKQLKPLKPRSCPYCDSKNVGVLTNPYENERSVVCFNCKESGPIARQHEDAIKSWNELVVSLILKADVMHYLKKLYIKHVNDVADDPSDFSQKDIQEMVKVGDALGLDIWKNKWFRSMSSYERQRLKEKLGEQDV